MTVTLVMLASVDGKITKGDDANVSQWASTEDQQHFNELKQQAEVIVMGRRTYQLAKAAITLEDGKPRIVLTTRANELTGEPRADQISFSSEEPGALLKRLANEGVQKVLPVGGSELNTSFFKAGLVDELYLTIEPLIFGVGKSLFSDALDTIKLELIETKQFNQKGTIIFHYTVP